MSFIDRIKWDADGLVPMVVQDAASKDVLMVGWSNREAVEKTVASGNATFWSRSRKKLWTKGESSGNTMRVTELLLDCDVDTIVALVVPRGPACHEGYRSCFFRRVVDGELVPFGEREFDPCDVYGDQKASEKKE